MSLFLSKPGKRYGSHFLLPSNQMRGITPPSSRPHRCCQQSQRIESLAFTDLTRRNEHYRRRHWSIATSYDLRLPHRQRRHLAPPPSDDEDDDDEDEDNEDEDNSDEDDEDEDNSDDDNDSEDDVDDDDDDDDDDYYYYIILDNNDDVDDNEYVDSDDDNNDVSDDEDSDNDDNHSYDNDDDNKDDDEDNDEDDNEDDDEDDNDDDDNEYDEAASVIERLHTQLNIVQRLIDVGGPDVSSRQYFFRTKKIEGPKFHVTRTSDSRKIKSLFTSPPSQWCSTLPPPIARFIPPLRAGINRSLNIRACRLPRG